MNSRQKFLPRSPESLERDLVAGWQGRFFEIFTLKKLEFHGSNLYKDRYRECT